MDISAKDNVYIVMPAYNEAGNIETTVIQWHPVIEKAGAESRLVIVNDGSTDATGEVLAALQQKYPQLIAIDKPNSGHGPTCLFAYDYAINAGAEFVFQTDSDGQTNPDEFWSFWNKRREADFIIGARKNRKDGVGRMIVTKTLRTLIFVVFGKRIEDANTPFRLMNAQKLKPLLDIIPKDSFLSNVLMSVLVVERKEKYCWLPISFKSRQAGMSSINIKRIAGIGYKAIGDFYKVKRRIKQQVNE